MVGQVDYDSLRRSFDSGVRPLDEALQSFRMPMISTRFSRIGIHTLLNDGPLAIVGDNETVQI
jgi:hypothetical protein